MDINNKKQICVNKQCMLSVHGECHQLPKLYWECLYKEDGSVSFDEDPTDWFEDYDGVEIKPEDFEVSSLTVKYDADWCKGCVFEHRWKACDHDADNCKKVIKELQSRNKSDE